MQPRLILYIIVLKCLSIKSQEFPFFSGPFNLDFYYTVNKFSRNNPIRITTRLIPQVYVNNSYVLKTEAMTDNKKFIIRDIDCITFPNSYDQCGTHFKSSYLLFEGDMSIDDYVLKFEYRYDFNKLLRDLSQRSFDTNDFQLICVPIDLDFHHVEKPKDPDQYPLSKTNLFGIIFLSVCIVLVFMFCFGWFTVIYYRRFRQYRIKKKLRKELEQSTQEILDKSPVIIFDLNNQNQDHIDDEPICAICLEIFKLNEKLRKLVCKHYFHITCIDPWLLSHQSCPLCNRNILRNSIPSISSSIIAVVNERHNDESTSISNNDNNQITQRHN